MLGVSAVEHVDEFLELEQPERQFEIEGVDDVGAPAEAAAEFIVAVEQEHAQLRACVENRVENHRDAARLADAGRAENGEMLGQHVVERDPSFDRVVVMERADRDAGLARVGVDEAQLVRADDVGGVADRGVDRHAAREARDIASIQHDLAHQIDARDGAEAARAGLRRLAAFDLGDHADQPARPCRDAQESADRRARLLQEHRRWQRDAGLGAAHAENLAQRMRLRRDVGKTIGEMCVHAKFTLRLRGERRRDRRTVLGSLFRHFDVETFFVC